MSEITNLKLLYVEDEPETRIEMEKFLKRRFSRLITASNGTEGLERFNEFKPDIIIADLLMEGIGGIEMIESIRDEGSDCSVIITSALSDTASILETVALGIDSYLLKPINTLELNNILEKISGRILRQKTNDLRFDIGKKKELETELRLAVSAFIKQKTGKGPRKINIFIGNDHIELGVNGFLTPFDESLLEDRRNFAVVEQNRRLFYKTVKHELEEIVCRIISHDTQLSDIDINPELNREKCIFKY